MPLIAYCQMRSSLPRRNQDALLAAGKVVQVKALRKTRCWQVDEFPLKLAVADGVSASANAHLASHFWMQAMAGSNAKGLAFLTANFPAFCQALATQAPEAATTFAGVWLDKDGRGQLCNIGDSRVYRIDAAGRWQQLSHDHSVLNELLASGEAMAGVAYSGMYDALAECLVADSSAGDFSAYASEFCLAPGESVLLCSDGLTRALDHTQLEHIWQKHEGLDARLEALRRAVKRNPPWDDLSLVAACQQP